jgi:ethanolamine utilization microcompartment shell protein EutS
LPWLGAGVLALLASIFAGNNYHLKQQVASLQNQLEKQKDAIAMLQESQTQLVSLKGMEDSSDAYGKVIITPGHPEAILLIQNLPVLPSGKSYQLWCVVNGKKIASGHFNSNAQKKVFVKVTFSVTSDISALAVTVEVSPNPPIPKGPMVMTSSL